MLQANLQCAVLLIGLPALNWFGLISLHRTPSRQVIFGLRDIFHT